MRWRRHKRIEAAITQAVHDHWRWLRRADTLVASVPNAGAMGQPGLTPGLPDLLVIGPDVPGRLGFIELKRDAKAPTSPAQREFHDLCQRLGIACVVTHGRDEPIRVLETWNVVKHSVNDVERAGDGRLARGDARVATG